MDGQFFGALDRRYHYSPGLNHLRVHSLEQRGAAAFMNIFYTPQASPTPAALRTGMFWGKQITYEVRNGLAIYQNDMVLGPLARLQAVQACATL